MRSGVKLLEVLIEDGIVSGFGVDKKGDIVNFPLTRRQHRLFTKFNHDTPEFRAQLRKEFDPKVISEDFFVTNKDM